MVTRKSVRSCIERIRSAEDFQRSSGALLAMAGGGATNNYFPFSSYPYLSSAVTKANVGVTPRTPAVANGWSNRLNARLQNAADHMSSNEGETCAIGLRSWVRQVVADSIEDCQSLTLADSEYCSELFVFACRGVKEQGVVDTMHRAAECAHLRHSPQRRISTVFVGAVSSFATASFPLGNTYSLLLLCQLFATDEHWTYSRLNGQSPATVPRKVVIISDSFLSVELARSLSQATLSATLCQFVVVPTVLHRNIGVEDTKALCQYIATL